MYSDDARKQRNQRRHDKPLNIWDGRILLQIITEPHCGKEMGMPHSRPVKDLLT
ncbi:predicted protein [Botrytis cinerea T4]|uniref:Uncharacterized protein n=1 Tax=Botryotinia fuckeliana (strain T4) TaxID=999810 RepID=G2XVE1_BOTF4|nr:predicted protein [Botrytis cinerea T4]